MTDSPSRPDLPPVYPPVDYRTPRYGCFATSLIVLVLAIGYGLWRWTGRLWIALPGGVVGGYLLAVLLNAWAKSRRRFPR